MEETARLPQASYD